MAPRRRGRQRRQRTKPSAHGHGHVRRGHGRRSAVVMTPVERSSAPTAVWRPAPIPVTVPVGSDRTIGPSTALAVKDRLLAGVQSVTAGEGATMVHLVPLGLSGLALAIWAASVPGVDIRQMTDLGLVSVLTPGVFVALVLLSVGFAITLHHRRLRPVLLGLQLGLLILVLYGTATLVEEAPRFSVVYKHAGFVEFISRTGHLNTSIDAYFFWPGFFVMTAFVTKIAALPGALDLAPWASVFFNALWAGPLYMILTSASADRRLAWLGLWLFYLTDWVGQDYLSPQALNYFFYLVIIAALLSWFSPRARVWRSLTDWRRGGLVACVLVVFAAIVSSHPLTPVFAIAAVIGLVVLRRFKPRMLPVAMVAMNAGWVLVVALPLLTWQANLVFGSAGQVDTIVSASVTDRFQGSPEHEAVIATRIGLTAVLWAAGAFGAFRRFRAGHRDYTFAILAVIPLAIIPLQVYGGEIALRAYMFSLPAVVFFAASNFFGGRHPVNWRSAIAVATLGAVLIVAFLVTRYGNERIDYITYQEVAGVTYLYEIAPPGSIFVSTGYVPWRQERVEQYDLRDLPAEALVNTDVNAVIKVMTASPHRPAYFLFTRSEDAQVNMFYGLPRPGSSAGTRSGALERLVDAMIASGRFRIVYSNTDALILALVGSGK